MRWTCRGHGEEKRVQNFDWEPEGKRSPGRPRRRCEDFIKMDIAEAGWRV